MAMAKLSPQNIFETESFLKDEIILDENDSITYSNVDEKKCGEIILQSNNKFWFHCTFCDERFHSIVIFLNHIKGVHITDAEHFWNINHDNPLDLDSSEECTVEMDAEENCYEYEHFSDIKVNNYKLDGDSEIEEFNEKVIVSRSESNGMEELIQNQNNNVKNCTKSSNMKDEDGVNSSNKPNEALSSKNIQNIKLSSKKLPTKWNSKKIIYSCSYCHHKAQDKKSLTVHLNSKHITRNKYQCEECGKCFRDQFNLKSHLVIHTGARPFKCDFCDASFSHANSLKAHRYLHTGNRPYQCIQCDKGFVSAGALKVHMREHTGETPYVCQICNKAFATQCSYKRHMISHSGERAHECQQCGKAFIHKGELTCHMASHSTEKKFACDTCAKSFTNKKNLSQHKKLHLHIKQYICKVCNKEFAQHAGLYSHMKCHKNSEKRRIQ